MMMMQRGDPLCAQHDAVSACLFVCLPACLPHLYISIINSIILFVCYIITPIMCVCVLHHACIDTFIHLYEQMIIIQ